MEVILLERVEKLGQMGDEVTVKDGFARNFLLPRRKAIRATDENRKQFENRRNHLEAENLSRKQEAESVSEKLVDFSVTVIRQAGDSGQLYGSVSARDIASGASDQGVTIGRNQVVLDRAIKTLGMYPVKVVLHPEVSLEISINVARSEEEAKLQAAGIDVTAIDDGDDDDEQLEAEEAFASDGDDEAAENPDTELAAESED